MSPVVFDYHFLLLPPTRWKVVTDFMVSLYGPWRWFLDQC
jgi:hypothetical protein